MRTTRKTTRRRAAETYRGTEWTERVRSRKPPSPTARLEGERARLLRRLEDLRARVREVPQSTLEEVDPTIAERQRDWALLERLHARLAAIERALCAAREGRYMLCEKCGLPIGAARLKILLETRLCVHCKRQHEKMTVRRVLIGG